MENREGFLVLKIIAIFLSYLIGTVSFSLYTGKLWKGIDLREHGSGNLGATNTFRVLGLGPGILVLIGDILKGILAVQIGKWLGGQTPIIVILCGIAAIIGHSWPFYLKFRGGKGIATGAGVLLSIAPTLTIICAVIWLFVVFMTKYVSLGSIIAASIAALGMWFFPYPTEYKVLILIAAVFVIFRHRSNIQRLLRGNENRVGGKR